MGEVMYKEITPYPESTDRWNDITINSGASQRTLDDIKLPESAGCFTYEGDRKHAEGTINRFIYWRTFNDVMELVEVSLDANLRGNCLRLHFERSPILQGVSIHETADQVVILLATVSTIHRLNFPHPRKLEGMDHFLKSSDAILPSIFFEVSNTKIYDHSSFYVLNHTMSAKVPLPHTSCSWLMQNGEAAFVLANRLGSHLLVVMGEKNEAKVTVAELKRTSVMSRLWNGLVRNSQSGEVALSIVCYQNTSDAYIFSLCRDLRIRMWSQNKQECLMMASVFDHREENGNITPCNYNAQQCYLKKSIGSSPSEYFLGVYISQPPQNQFFIFQPLYIADQYRLSHIATLYHERHDLVDFCLSSSYVWTLWLNAHSEPVIQMTAIESTDDHTPVRVSWLSVDLEPPVTRDVYVPFDEVNPKEAYLKEIFRQGRFSPSTVSKAINIYRRIADTSFSFTSSGVGSLRDEAVKAVENEIFAKTRETDLADEEREELELECWDKFFSYCIQYHEVGTKPLGLAFDPTSGYAIVIKKNVYSLLCPCDSIEQLILSNSCYNPMTCSLNPVVKEDGMLSYSILAIFQCLNTLKKHTTEEMMMSFEYDLYRLQSPDLIALELIKELEVASRDAEGCLLMKLQSQLNMASHLLPALKLLLQKVDLSEKEDAFDMDEIDCLPFNNYPHFLSGSAGISILCEGVSQFARQRFFFCRDLLMLELLIIRLGFNSGISVETSSKIEMEIVPLTRRLVQAYYALKWCTECEFVPNQSSFLETGLKQLSLVDLPDVVSPTKFKIGNGMGKTVVYYYLVEQGRRDAYSLLSQVLNDEFSNKNWTHIFPHLILNIGKVLWPLGPHFQFPEFLLSQCQYAQLQGYVRLLERWCSWNSFSRQFLSANCFLIVGEHTKALQLFIQVAEGVDKEEYIHNKIMQGIDESTTNSTAQYYMKVIQMFEHFGLSQCIIDLAVTAVGILGKNDIHIPTFWSLAFKHHLELGNSDEAYMALTKNPDPSRQKDCLRQLIVVLCERRQFQTLVEFPYMDMQDEVINILESRARSSDLLKQDFYDLLYAFHIHTNNFRKAASIMFEYGMRLGQEVHSLEGLKKQSSCYLSAINCLHLVDPKYAWIVKPVPKITTLSNGLENESPGMSPKRNADGDEIYNLGPSKKIDVLELQNIRQEYDLIHARLLLVERDQSPTNMAATPLSATDCVALLIGAGLFDTAIGLCKSFSLSFIPIFEGLTYRCVKLMQSKSKWLKENEIEFFDCASQNESSLYSASGYLSAQEQMWYLLKYYLEQCELESQTVFHRCVAMRLFSFGVQLPAWLKRSYQRCNPAELLLLYINYGLLEDATDLALNYIDAILESREMDFGIKYPLLETSPPVWLPHTYFDALLDALEDVQNGVYCTELYKRLTEKLNLYQEKVMSVSENMLASASMKLVF